MNLKFKNQLWKILMILLLILVTLLITYLTIHFLPNNNQSNSIKVNKVYFVQYYNENYKEEKKIKSYSNTNGLFARIYFEDPIDSKTPLYFIWKNKNNDGEIERIQSFISLKDIKEPYKVYLTDNNGLYIPDGDYILEIYDKKTDMILSTSTVSVSQ